QVDIFTRDVELTKADEFVDKHLGSISVKSAIKTIEDRAARQKDRLVGEDITNIPVKTRSNVDTTSMPLNTSEVKFPSMEEFTTAATNATTIPEGCIIQENLLIYAKTGLMYVPEDLGGKILYYHYSRVGAHQGAQKMIVRIKKHFYWPNLAKDCVDFTAD
ncbi:hypothetical protein GNI_213860, partial [Gregarina niphandrodes]